MRARKTVAPLNVIPESVLKYSKKLLGLSRIEVLSRRIPLKSQNYLEFLNEYGPSIRYHNDH